MARVVGIDHLVIRVKDFERSKAFYDTVLGFLGFKRKYTFGDAAGWSNGKTLFWIGEADAQGKKHPHRIGKSASTTTPSSSPRAATSTASTRCSRSTSSTSSTRRPTIPTTARAITRCSSPIRMVSSSKAWCSSRRARRSARKQSVRGSAFRGSDPLPQRCGHSTALVPGGLTPLPRLQIGQQC